jgi:hypothetical protein
VSSVFHAEYRVFLSYVIESAIIFASILGQPRNDMGQIVILDGELLETMRSQWDRRKVVTIAGQSPTLLCPFVS